MKITTFLIGLLLFSTCMQAQERATDPGFDKARSTLSQVMAGYNLTFSHFGNIYFLVCSVRKGKLKNSRILFYKNDGFDTIEIKESDRAILEPVLLYFSDKKDLTIILPCIYIKDPKRLPTNEFLYRESVPRNLIKALYLITRKDNEAVIFPLAEGISWTVSAS